jgi:CheY-like chemotaxis protein
MATADMLKDLGYEVVEARRRSRRCAAARTGSGADLVVTDHLMPGMTGVDLARRLQGRTAAVPVLMISGYAEKPRGSPRTSPRLTKPFRQRRAG